MTDRRKSRPRPTRRRATAASYMQVFAEGASRRTVLKGLFATTALAAGGIVAKVAPALAASPSTLTFTELEGGRTRIEALSVVESIETRDAILKSGMDVGVIEGYEKLDELLAGA